MKVSENKPHLIAFRVTDKQKKFLDDITSRYGIDIADYLRIIINKRIILQGEKKDANNEDNLKHKL